MLSQKKAWTLNPKSCHKRMEKYLPVVSGSSAAHFPFYSTLISSCFFMFLLQCGQPNDKLSPIEVFEIAFPPSNWMILTMTPLLWLAHWMVYIGLWHWVYRFTMVYHMITMNLLVTAQVIYAFVAFSSFVSAMTNATNELRAFTRLGRNAMGGCPKWNSYFNREDMWENDDRPLVFWMVLGFLILRQPALKVWRCGTSICSIARDIGSCTTLDHTLGHAIESIESVGDWLPERHSHSENLACLKMAFSWPKVSISFDVTLVGLKGMPGKHTSEARLKSARQEAQIRKFLGDKKLGKSGRYLEDIWSHGELWGFPKTIEKCFEDVDDFSSIMSRCPTFYLLGGAL